GNTGSAGGAGGAATTGPGPTSSVSTNASTSTGINLMVCNGGAFIEVIEDNGAAKLLKAGCSGTGTTGPTGHMFAGGPVGAPHGVTIQGCAAGTAVSQGITLTALDASGPGTYTMGSAQYTDAMGAMWGTQNDPFKAIITGYDPVGG